MTLEQQKKYIQEQRLKGISDDQILNAIKQVETPSPQRSFAGELVPTVFSVGGGVLGAMGGSVVPGVGTVAGGVGGATAGATIGETIQQTIEKKFGQRDTYNPGQIAAQGAISGTLEATGAIFAKVGSLAFQASKPTMVKFLSKMSGYADDVLEKTLQRTPGAIQGVKDGEQALVDVVQKTATGISKYAKDLVKENAAKIAEFTKRSVTGNLPGTKQALLGDGLKYERKIVDSLRQQFNIGVTKTGELMFDRARDVSNIVSGGDRQAIQSAYQSILKIAKNPDISNIDSILERLIVLRSKTPVGSPTGAETRAIINTMSDSVVDFVRSLKGYGSGYQQYADWIEQTLPKRILINDAKEIFGGTEHLSPKEVSQISKRLLQLYNTGNLAVREFAEDVGQKIGVDITGTSAGTLLKTGDQQSVRAPNLTVRGAATRILEYLPREAVKNYVESGTLTGVFGKTIELISKITGLSTKAIMTEIVNLSANKTTQ